MSRSVLASRKKSRPARPENDARLSRKNWVDAAILALQECSIDALRVPDLAEALGVTKGSFYHHFTGRDELLAAVLAQWKGTMIEQTQHYILRSSGTPLGRIRRMIRIAMASQPNVPGGPLEIRLREWAHREPKVAAVVKQVDKSRLVFLQKLYEAAGLTAQRARAYAFIHMSYVIGARVFLDGKSNAEYTEGIDLGEEFLFPLHGRD